MSFQLSELDFKNILGSPGDDVDELKAKYSSLGLGFWRKKHADFERIHKKSSAGCFMSGRGLILSSFNDLGFIEAYSDKNLYDIVVRTERKPRTPVRCVSGSFFDQEYRSISCSSLVDILGVGNSYILKPSRGANGKGIKKVLCTDGGLAFPEGEVQYKDLIDKFGGDFQIQELIRQHSAISEIHPHSVNSLRMLTFRWKGEIRYLLSFMRVGCDGAVNDNAGTGGICVGVDDYGKLKGFAVNKDCDVLEKHPSTGYDFSKQITIPNFDRFIEFVIKLHSDIPHHDLVSWDIAVSDCGSPVFIEHNFRGALWLYQIATGKPLFGKYTDEVACYLLSQKESPSYRFQSNCRHQEDIKRKKQGKAFGSYIANTSGKNEVISKKVVVNGNVQGVGYRKWLQKTSRARNVSGWVRNVADGRVEAVLQGLPEQVSAVFLLMQKGPRRALVDKVEIEPVKSRAARTGFKILKSTTLSDVKGAN